MSRTFFKEYYTFLTSQFVTLVNVEFAGVFYVIEKILKKE